MNVLLQRIKKSDILLSVFTLGVGSVVSQVIPIVSSLILARLYSPEAFGIWGVFSSYVTMLAIIGCGRYETVIVQTKRIVDAINLVALSVLIISLLSIVFFIVILFSDVFHWQLLDNVKCKYLLPVYLFFLVLIQIYSSYANRVEAYKFIASASILQSFVQSGIRILLGLFKGNYLGLIYGALFGAIASASLGYRFRLSKGIIRCFSWRKCKELALTYKRMPLYDAPSKLVNRASSDIPIILLAYYFTDNDVGLFSMSMSLLFLPMSFIGGAIGKVFYKKASIYDEKQTALLACNIFKVTFLIGLIPVLILISGGEIVFASVLGSKWTQVGVYSLYMSLWVWCLLCFCALEPILIVRNRQRLGLNLNIVMFVFRIIAIIVGGYILKSVVATILLYGFVGLIMWGIEGIFIWKIIGIKMKRRDLFIGISILLLVFLFWIIRVVNSIY